AEMRHAGGVTHGNRLRDAAADTVPHETRAFDAQLIHQCNHTLGVRAHIDGAVQRTIAATVSKQVDDDDAMARRHERNDVAPQVSRRRKSVQKYDGIAPAAGAGGVVVESRAGEIEKLTAH